MSFLLRERAPLTEQAWATIDHEAVQALRHFLSARRLVDFVSVGGWATDSVGTGEVLTLNEPTEGVSARARRALPLIELRHEFTLDRAALEAIDRKAASVDLGAVVEASRRFAAAEDRLVFNGDPAADVVGLASGSTHDALSIHDDYSRYPSTVAEAAAMLREAGVGGPFGIALGPRCHRGVIETTEKGGYPILEHLRLILGGPVVWAPEIDGAVVMSLRGGDHELLSGQDISIGYSHHDATTVTLFLVQSMTFRNLSPEAAVVLRYS